MAFLVCSGFLFFFSGKDPTGETNLQVDNDGADEHADALEQISNHVDKGCSHAGVGLLSLASWENIGSSSV